MRNRWDQLRAQWASRREADLATALRLRMNCLCHYLLFSSYLSSFQVVTLELFVRLKFDQCVPVFTLALLKMFCQFLNFLYEQKIRLLPFFTQLYQCTICLRLRLYLSNCLITKNEVSSSLVTEDASSNSFWSFWLVSALLFCCRYSSSLLFAHWPWWDRQQDAERHHPKGLKHSPGGKSSKRRCNGGGNVLNYTHYNYVTFLLRVRFVTRHLFTSFI